jgi:uncharacterized protein YjbJ (UPF0337 family)
MPNSKVPNSVKHQVEGALHEAKGAVKQKVGETIGNPDLADEGRGEKAAGKLLKKVGQVEAVFDK